jgi:hypothetical protein
MKLDGVKVLGSLPYCLDGMMQCESDSTTVTGRPRPFVTNRLKRYRMLLFIRNVGFDQWGED